MALVWEHPLHLKGSPYTVKEVYCCGILLRCTMTVCGMREHLFGCLTTHSGHSATWSTISAASR